MKPLARIDVERRDGVVVARVQGDIDLSNADEVRRALESEAAAATIGLVVELSQTGYIDSSGVALLVGVAREFSVRRQRLLVVAPPRSAGRRVLEIVQFGEVAGVFESVDDAVASLATPESA